MPPGGQNDRRTSIIGASVSEPLLVDSTAAFIIIYIMHSEMLDEPIHGGKADWMSANSERGISTTFID